jgi:hypothetical protein
MEAPAAVARMKWDIEKASGEVDHAVSIASGDCVIACALKRTQRRSADEMTLDIGSAATAKTEKVLR